MEGFTRNAYQPQKTSEKWTRDGLLLAPYAARMIEEQRQVAGDYEVIPSIGKTFVQDTELFVQRV
jgi:hypothetical protein